MQIGIDIGTHTARAAWIGADGRPQLIRLPNGSTVLPAFVRQTMHGLVVGEEAAHSLVGNTETTIYGCTRLMGRAGTIPAQLIERLPFTIRDHGGEASCNLLYAEVRASDAYGQIVATLARAASQALGRPIERIVLTVPSSAEDRFRIQARAAVEAQGLQIHRLINQPTAAILALGVSYGPRIAVVSCAGGTTEVTIAERSGDQIRVLATGGNPLMGGDDLAWTVAERLNERFRTSAGIDVFGVDESRIAAQGLRRTAEDILERLCVAQEAVLTIDHGGGFGRDLATTVRRSDIDIWLRPSLETLAGLCRRTLEQARLHAQDIQSVVLIGDWAYLPSLQEAVAAAFARPVGMLQTQGAEALAAYGAAIAAASNAPSIWDVTPYPLGINCYYGNTELLSPIIRANTPIPTPPAGTQGAYTESYHTLLPDQTSVRLDVLQYRGLRDAKPQGNGQVTPQECEQLGSWEFTGLKPKRGQQAAFTVTFAVDADGILHLTARETATGRTLTAQVDRGVG